MSFESAFLELMGSTIKVSTRTTLNNYGEALYSNSTSSYRARIVQMPTFARDGDSETVAYSHVIWARSTGSVSITVDDRVTLPGGAVYPVSAVERYPDEDGQHHVKIMLGY